MMIDPQVIRSERHKAIGTLIQRDAGLLIERWCQQAMEEERQAQRVHHEVLRDQLPKFLCALGHSLAESETPDTVLHRKPAVEHGAQRWENGWSLPEVIRDFQILRLVILEYLHEALDRPLREREIMAVSLALDEAIAASVAAYVHNREQYVGQVEQRRLELEKSNRETLQQANRRKDEFLAILGHELRNSLAPLLNSVEVLRLLGSKDPALVQVKDVVERQVKQMIRLVDDLLDLSRISCGQIELRKERQALAAVITQAIETSNPLVEALGHRLSVELPAAPLSVLADRARLVQIIANLLNNAAKYTDRGGAISLSVERKGEEAVIRVRDTGVGIPPEKLGSIFDLFMQIDPSRERSQGGLGVGLALVRRLAEMHGGQVAAHSEGLGQGSEFTVTLPLCSDAGQQSLSAAAPNCQSQVSRHVLLVEDNPDGRETMETLLQLLGHRVEVAEDGAQGVAKALTLRPEVALIDLGLPGLDGYQVVKQLRAALGSTIYLIALTGYGQAEDRRRTQEAGFDAHLVKPVDTEELSRLLAELPRPEK